ncbi:MAG TPA: type I polyketide synthase [Pyrinomonadaceae bacterium]|nr:type I polyketide synthase [Pyrinomonadaceae bacterium]
MVPRIAIVGMACTYPDARSPQELWENVLSQRRAFRSIPPQRLRLEDYWSKERGVRDVTYCSQAAVIEGYEFDRIAFSVGGDAFRSADMTHWLALDTAARALNDGGFDNGDGLPRETTGVFLGNTLTGEFSRANLMRLRWPYVRRVIDASLAGEGWPVEDRSRFLQHLESLYKEPFPNINEESLAGGLSNTIAGRICNHFDLKGGGYTIDGACSSSLLAVANACSSLVAEDIDVALAGGVDLSLDPFELVGFAKAGALATGVMRVYDRQSAGFIPGEGCGMILLMRYEDAVSQGRRVYATINGWGISSDGKGGITRPEVEGQLLALRRAYRRAGFGIDTVAYFEGHGTGTSVGDTVELQALSRARTEADAPAAIGSIKANIGHTKAAAGIAGLIKATLALKTGIIPPTTGCEHPHSEITRQSAALRVLKTAEAWPNGQPRRAGVSSMGFGGINVHLVVEANGSPQAITSAQRTLMSTPQDAELFLLKARNADELLKKVEHLLTFAAGISQAELSDLARELQRTLTHDRVRAAIVASSPRELADRLEKLRSRIVSGASIDPAAGVFLSTGPSEPRIGFLFPGQGSPSHVDGGALRRRFDYVRQLYERSTFPAGRDDTATEIAQPAIMTASIAGMRVLAELGITAQVAVGHSLGELAALHWAGAIDEQTLLDIAKVRGQAMKNGNSAGAMASIAAGLREVETLTGSAPVFIAGINSPHQTVISGEAGAVDSVVTRALAQHLKAVRLHVSSAFHSPIVANSADVLTRYLANVNFNPLDRVVVSTVTGEVLTTSAKLTELLRQQITSPVLFMNAATVAEAQKIDLWLEVGPGQVLGGLMNDITGTPVISLDAGGSSLRGLLNAAAAAFVLGQAINHAALFEGRFTRPFDLNWQPKFFVNPCELAPVGEVKLEAAVAEKVEVRRQVDASGSSTLDVLVQLIAERAELPAASIGKDSRLLSDLHLNSITVSQLVVEAAMQTGLPSPVSPTDFADATVEEIAQALDEQRSNAHLKTTTDDSQLPAGVDAWIRTFNVQLVERPLSACALPIEKGVWEVIAPSEQPFADDLRASFEDQAGDGVIVYLSRDCDETIVGLLLASARQVLQRSGNARFVVVQHGHGAAAFARTLHLEAPNVTTCVVNVPESEPRAIEWVVAEALAADGFVEAYYDRDGRRSEKVMQLLPLQDRSGDLPLTTDDVLLVSGGGKGITAECAIAIAKETGARLALIGRAAPETDPKLAANLERMRANGITFKYISADLNDATLVREAVQNAEEELGPITGILHGAARNQPQLLKNLDEDSFQRTLSVKVQGARNLLAAVDPEKLRLFIGFGSVIARTGLPGEADYALANEWLTRLVEDWKLGHPSCRCLAIDWSIWSEIGMGARLMRKDRLVKEGITPIPPEQGVAILLELLRQPEDVVSVVVMGRYSDLPTFRIETPELPFLRFLEKIKVYYPKIELIVDVDLSRNTDPYLDDHALQGRRLLPAVMGLEAMAQVAAALAGSPALPAFKAIEFNRPVVVSENAPLPIRLAALVRRPGVVEVVLRSAETGFQVDHFRATCEFAHVRNGSSKRSPAFRKYGNNRVSLDPATDLYGNILFQSGRFQRVDNYRHLNAKECFAEIAPDGHTSWFIHHLPSGLLLGDPGARDAAMHAIQACIPHRTLLPVSAESVSLERAISKSDSFFISARERSCTENTFIYDLDILGVDGLVHERWRGLKLQAVGAPIPSPRQEALLGPYLERRVRELIPGSDVAIVLQRDNSEDRQTRSDRAIQTAVGMRTAVSRRPDGKPEVRARREVSAAHNGDLTIAVAGPKPVGCDLELVAERTPFVWRGLLGDERNELAQLVARRAQENGAVSATRIWSASEAMKKAGAMITAPLIFVSSTDDGCVLLSSGSFKILTYATELREREGVFVIAVLSQVD